MRRIHPRSAGAIFGLSYYLIGFLIYLIFHKNLFEYKIYIILGATIGLIVHILFEKKYYDEPFEEKRRESDFFNKAIQNRKKMEEE